MGRKLRVSLRWNVRLIKLWSLCFLRLNSSSGSGLCWSLCVRFSSQFLLFAQSLFCCRSAPRSTKLQWDLNCWCSLSNTSLLCGSLLSCLHVGGYTLGGSSLWRARDWYKGSVQCCVCPTLGKLASSQRSLKWVTFSRPVRVLSEWFKWVTHTEPFKVRSNPFKKVRPTAGLSQIWTCFYAAELTTHWNETGARQPCSFLDFWSQRSWNTNQSEQTEQILSSQLLSKSFCWIWFNG